MVKPAMGAVVFDWYETLVRVTSEMRLAMFDRVAGEAGLDLPAGTLGQRWREAARTEQGYPFDGPVPPFRSFRARWRDRGEALLETFGVLGGGELVVRHYADLHANAVAYPEAGEALDGLSSRYRLGVLSDADTDFLQLNIDQTGLNVTAVLCSEELQNYKPHVETFRTICDRLGARPDETVFVGDQPRSDIAGARHAGLTTVWVNRNRLAWPGHPYDPGGKELPAPDVEVTSLAHLEPALS